ncbi:hypothetical protein GCM10010331_63820 [Streptomyces xanthochromogenes]|nr:hypothetical protein GCM10010331_63820 [Streptomyces xanthochromogenes]
MPPTPFSSSGRGWLVAQFLAPLKDSVLASAGTFSPSGELRTSAVQARTGVQGAEPPQGSGAQPQGPGANQPRATGGRVGKSPRAGAGRVRGFPEGASGRRAG